MSYDVGLYIHTGKEEIKVLDVGSITYNVGDIFEKALGFRLGKLYGMSARYAIPLLEAGLADMRDPEKQEEYIAMNPRNGFGSFDGARMFLLHMLENCKRHPVCVIKVM